MRAGATPTRLRKPPQFSFAKAERRVTCYYFYVWDESWGPAFIKVCAYFPYPVKVWLNGHEWAKMQLASARIGFTELSNGFARCDDPDDLQMTCDRLGPGDIQAFFGRWMSRIPLPLTADDRAAGYWWELSLRQVEVFFFFFFFFFLGGEGKGDGSPRRVWR